jgi:ABC-type polysaccharide/polyol phosphate transport system ATPase subunit
MFMRLAFSLAVHADPEILLVDEALSVGDEAFQEKCYEKLAALKQEGVSIAFVSHNLELVQEFCDRAIVLDHGHLAFTGDPAAAVDFYRDLSLLHHTPVQTAR